ncbi:MAG: hypothetical protein H9533_17695 [Rhodobacteraceae bacterium]|nr:hypothetical protein [Paracoccaceae bacterium]
MEFKISRRADLAIALCLFLLLAVFGSFLFFGGNDFNLGDVFASVFLASAAFLLVFSCRRVTRIVINEEGIILLPEGVKLPKEQISEIKITYPEVFLQRGELNRLSVEMHDESFYWVPFIFLRFKKNVSIRITGISDPHGFIGALRAFEERITEVPKREEE